MYHIRKCAISREKIRVQVHEVAILLASSILGVCSPVIFVPSSMNLRELAAIPFLPMNMKRSVKQLELVGRVY